MADLGSQERRRTVPAALKQAANWALQNWWLTLAIALVLAGVLLRTRRMFFSPIPFWGDEALSATEVMVFRYDLPSVRPVGFMLLSKFIAKTFGASDVALRFLPWLAGVLGTALSIPLAQRLFKAPGARVLLVALIAFSPNAIDFSKEFKPYSVSLCLHIFCLYAAASYWDTRETRWLLATLVVSLFGVLFAQDVLFAYPGLYLAMGLTALRSGVTRQRVWVAVGATLTLGLLLALYLAYWRHMGGPQSLRKGHKIFGYVGVWWSRGYDLFHVKPEESWLSFYFRKYVEIATFPGARRGWWGDLGPLSGTRLDSLRHIDTAIWTLLHAIALILIVVRRRLREFLLLVVPLLVLTAFNVAQRWPGGAFRVNLFVLAYAAAILCIAFDHQASPEKKQPLRQLVPVLVLSLLPLLLFERTWHRTKLTSGNSEFWQIANTLIELHDREPHPRRELLMLDGYVCSVWKYYENIYPRDDQVFGLLRRRFRWRCVKGWNSWPLNDARKLQGRHQDTVWLVLLWPINWGRLTEAAVADYDIKVQRKLEGDGALLVKLEPKR